MCLARSTWLRNTASYGPTTATIAYSLRLTSAATMTPYRSNDFLPISVQLVDFHGQPVTSEPPCVHVHVHVDSGPVPWPARHHGAAPSPSPLAPLAASPLAPHSWDGLHAPAALLATLAQSCPPAC
jgi:hypothetical protein